MTTILKLKVYGEGEKYSGSFQKNVSFVPSESDLVSPYPRASELEQRSRVWCIYPGRNGDEALNISLQPVFCTTRDEYGTFVSGLANSGWRKDDGK